MEIQGNELLLMENLIMLATVSQTKSWDAFLC